MRKLLSRLLLSVLLLLTQQGALLHELGHAAGAQAQTERDDGQAVAPEACAVCLSFSSVGAGTAPDGPPAHLRSDLGFRLSPSCTPSLATPEGPPARSRGPPVLA